ncbi:type II secretion system protein GspE, partial [bacterium]|nr:type II secretion system protein GspE [bacterium]
MSQAATATNSPRPVPKGAGRRLGEILIAQGAVDAETLGKALEVQAEKGGLIGEVLIRMKAVDEAAVMHALATQFHMEYVDTIEVEKVDPALVVKIPIHYAKRHFILPMNEEEERIVVACANPLDYEVLDDLRIFLGGEIKPVLSTQAMIFDTINLVYDKAKETSEEVLEDLEGEKGPESFDLDEISDIIDATDEDAPIIRLINHLLYRAVKERASDIHIEVFENDLVVRFRIDGVLYEVMRPPRRFQSAIATRIKIM